MAEKNKTADRGKRASSKHAETKHAASKKIRGEKVLTKRMLWKDIRKCIRHSLGRFISIMCLIALGSFALVGLQIAGPDMRATGTTFFDQYNAADLSVIGSYGIDEENQKAINKISGASDIEYGYLKDVVDKNTQYSIRIFSQTPKVSQYQLVSGSMPASEDEIALANSLSGTYNIGDEIKFDEKKDASGNLTLKKHTFKITGFVNSCEIVSSLNMGSSSAGSGELKGYAVVTPETFDSEVYMIARITFQNTKGVDPYTNEYRDLVQAHKDDLNKLLANQPNQRLDDIKAEYQKQIDSGQKKIDEAKEKLTTAENELVSAKATLDSANQELTAQREKLNSSKEELSSQETQLNNAQQELNLKKAYVEQEKKQPNPDWQKIAEEEKQIAAAQAELNAKSQQLNAAKEQLASGEATLNEKQAEYESGLAEYNTSLAQFNAEKPDAEKKIEDAEKKLAESQAEINNLETPTFSVDTRREIPGSEGYKVYSTVASSIDSLAGIFPIFLYLVAALVTLTTMTRFVDEERSNSGTLASLGYSNRDIFKKFIVYGLIASTVGSIIGIILGLTLMPTIVYTAYKASLIYPQIELHFYPTITLIAVLLGFLSAVLPAYLVARKELKEKPAALLLPKPPANGSKIFLERIKPVWKRLSFTHKVTARNLFRYKKRMFMTIFGVCGAVTLLFTGFSVQNAISTINDRQFGEILQYNLIVAHNSNLTDTQTAELQKQLNSDTVDKEAPIFYEQMTKVAGDKKDKQEITMITPENQDDFYQYIGLYDRNTKARIDFSDDGIIITEKLANVLGAKVGDSVTFNDTNDVERTMKISAITEMYTGHFIFMNSTYYKTVFDKVYTSNADLVILKDGSIANVNEQARNFMKLDSVAGVVQSTTMINQISTVTDSLNKIMAILIVVALLLACVILYNLTTINVSERVRELSTIKVLGFYDKEVTMYIYRETILLTALGILFGFLVGDILYLYIISVVAPDEVMFDPSLGWKAFVIPTIVISALSVFLGFVVNRRLKRLDMLGALKSID